MSTAAELQAGSPWRQYYALMKPRVVQLIVFCALIGMVLAGQPGLPLPAPIRRLVLNDVGPTIEPAALQRIGLSATQRPIEDMARFLVGVDRPCEVVDGGHRRDLAQGKIIERRPIAGQLVLQMDADPDPGRPRRRPPALLEQDPIRPSAVGETGDSSA